VTDSVTADRSSEWAQHFSNASCLIRQLYHFATDFDRILLRLLGTDIEKSLFKYRVIYRHLTVMIETFELLMKSCEKFNFLFVNIQCATACSLEKVNFKV